VVDAVRELVKPNPITPEAAFEYWHLRFTQIPYSLDA
jgi:hypothetical protein